MVVVVVVVVVIVVAVVVLVVVVVGVVVEHSCYSAFYERPVGVLTPEEEVVKFRLKAKNFENHSIS